MPKQSRKVVIYSVFVALLMFASTFAMVPLYRTLCSVTGLSTAVIDPDVFPDTSREITVQFVAVNNAELPWEFHPQKNSLVVHLNENAKMVFIAKNNSGKTMTVQAIPSFAPDRTGQYFHKIQCFCFNQQTLNSNESKEMLVVFRLDRKLPKEVHTITLAYTLFDVTDTKGTA